MIGLRTILRLALAGLSVPVSSQNAGQELFNMRWVASKGLGPLYNAPSCATCHPGGARGLGPTGNGPAPASLEIMLETSGHSGAGDPVYGHVLNTFALDGVAAEGAVSVRYTESYGYYYPDGSRWHLRTPHYDLSRLSHGSLAPNTIVEPRVAPALFGVGLLEAAAGRFGWQGASLSVRDQTTRAFSREMGVTSPDRPADDCTPAEKDCAGPAQEHPEVSEELLTALLTFEHSLAVPASSAKPKNAGLGSELFTYIGCSDCHVPRLPIKSADPPTRFIAAYTDLQLHDLGMEMADRTMSGASVVSKWRTAPLWGFGYRMQTENQPTFLHDGRARSAEEAILWHSGEAARARQKFTELGPRSRAALLHFLETL